MKTKNGLYFERQKLVLEDGQKLEIVPSYVANMSGKGYSSQLNDLNLENLVCSLNERTVLQQFDEISFALKNYVSFDEKMYVQCHLSSLPSIDREEQISIKYLIGKNVSFEGLLRKISEGGFIRENFKSLSTLGVICKEDDKLILTNAGAVRGFSYLKDGIREDKNRYVLLESFGDLKKEFEKGNIGKGYLERNGE